MPNKTGIHSLLPFLSLSDKYHVVVSYRQVSFFSCPFSGGLKSPARTWFDSIWHAFSLSLCNIHVSCLYALQRGMSPSLSFSFLAWPAQMRDNMLYISFTTLSLTISPIPSSHHHPSSSSSSLLTFPFLLYLYGRRKKGETNSGYPGLLSLDLQFGGSTNCHTCMHVARQKAGDR